MNAIIVSKNGMVVINKATNMLTHKNYHVYMCISLRIISKLFEKPITAKNLSGVFNSEDKKFEFSGDSKAKLLEGFELLEISHGNCLKIIDDCQNALSLAL